MTGFVTPGRFDRSLDLPISLPQTELRRGKQILVATIALSAGQQIWLRSLTLHVIRNLTPGPLPVLVNTVLGPVSAGLLFGSAVTAPLASVRQDTEGASCLNPFTPAICATPGVYSVVLSNNTSNIDYSVVLTGSAKIML